MPIHLPNIHKYLSSLLQCILCVGMGTALWEREWNTAVLTLMIILLTLIPLLVYKRFQVFIPPEFELLATAFLFCALFLGEIGDYYNRFWWWDIALHTTSGFLLGIVGFLLAHILNEQPRIDLAMQPVFVATFAFFFAIGIGAIWEIVEFTFDSLLGTTMQKPMLNDPSGLTDTMWDLIVDAVGALVISVLGYGYLKSAGNQSFLLRWIDKFIRNNPHLFRHSE